MLPPSSSRLVGNKQAIASYVTSVQMYNKLYADKENKRITSLMWYNGDLICNGGLLTRRYEKPYQQATNENIRFLSLILVT